MGNLNNAIASILQEYGDGVKQNWLHFSPIDESMGLQEDMRKANAFLRIQLGLLDVDTTRARECLTQEDSLKPWLDGFKEEIAPLIAQHGLPLWIA